MGVRKKLDSCKDFRYEHFFGFIFFRKFKKASRWRDFAVIGVLFDFERELVQG